MIHDPLCPDRFEDQWLRCVHCDLIARVEKRTLGEAGERVTALLDRGDCPDCSFTTRDSDILAALRGDK